MALEVKDLLEYQGLNPAEIDSIDKYKEKFNETFVKADVQSVKAREDLYKSVIGNTIGSLKTHLAKKYRDAGVTFTDEELNGKAVFEIFDVAFDKVVTPLSTKVKTLEENAGKGNDKKLTELQEQFEKYKSEVTPKIEGFEKLKSEYDGYKNTVAEEKKMGAINSHKEDAWKNFKWGTGVSEFTKEGFKNAIDKKYKVSLDDSGQVIATDEKGNRIQSGKTAGTYKTYAELITEEGIAATAKGERIYAVAQNGQGQQAGTFKAKEENTDKGQQNLNPAARSRALNTGVRERFKV